VFLDKGIGFMHVKYRVLTTEPRGSSGWEDSNYERYLLYLNAIGLEYEVQSIGDDWDRDDYCWYFDTQEQALQFKIYSGGRLL